LQEAQIRAAFLTFFTYIAFFCTVVSWFIIKRKWHRHDVSQMSQEEREEDPAFNEEDIIERLTD